MKPYYADPLATLYHADSRDMSMIPDESVDLIITSPPYWSARKYPGGADMIWDGDAAEGCEHVWGEISYSSHRNRSGAEGGLHEGRETNKLADNIVLHPSTGQFCQLCGAWRGQLGLEPTLGLYQDHILQIGAECHRVLKPSGVMVVNLGDSYAGSGGAGGDYYPGGWKDGQPRYPGAKASGKLKQLDLCMIPARVAIALQEEQGWYLRSDISWLKRASMPGSERGDSWQQHRVTQCPNCGALASFKKRVCQECGWEKGNKPPAIARDRAIDTAIHSYRGDGWETQAIEGREAEKVQYVDCPGCPKCIPNDGLVLLRGNWRPSKSTERLFIFSKTNNCYCDAEAVRVASVGTHSRGYNHKNVDPGRRADVWNAMPATMNPAGRNRREMDWFYESLDDLIADLEREARRLKHLRDNGGLVMDEEGNPLALLLNPKGFKDAHFATYPVALCEPFIKAYTSEKGNCPKCGLPWVRVIAPSSEYGKKLGGRGFAEADWKEAGGGSLKGQHYQSATADYRTLGWRPQCDCDAGEPVPPIVLDPFVGSGTTCQAASKLGRRSIGVECAEEYLEMAVKRIQAGHEAYHEARKVAGLSHEVAIEGDGDVRVEQTAMWEGK